MVSISGITIENTVEICHCADESPKPQPQLQLQRGIAGLMGKEPWLLVRQSLVTLTARGTKQYWLHIQ